MAETLRDLVVNLSLDSDNFSRNIKSINGQIKEAESEFKAAGAGVAGFEKTLDGAQAKAAMLEKKFEAQTKAVEQYQRALDAAQAKLEDSYRKHEQLAQALSDARSRYSELVAAEGENSDAAKAQAAEIKKLEGQIKAADRTMQSNANSVSTATTNLNNAKAALSQTESELRNTNSALQQQSSAWSRAADALNEFSERADSIGKKLTDFGKSMTLGVTTPIVAMGTACVMAFNEVDEGIDTIITKTGASGKTLEELSQRYENLFRTMPIEANEAGVAIGEVNTRFALMGQQLEDVSRQFIEFSRINSVDLNSAIDDVDSVMTKFGVDVSEVGNVLGYITKVSQDTGISVAALLSSLMSNGSSFKELGLDLGESIALLAQFELGGVDAGTALAGLRKIVQEAAKDGKAADKVIAEAVDSIKNARTESEALQIAMDLFGSKGAAEMASAIREGRLSVEDLSVSMGEYSSVVSETFEATLDLPDQATVALNNLKAAGADLASSAMTALAPVAQTLIEKLQGLVDRFKALDDGTKQRIAKIAALVALIGPVVSIAGKLTTTIGSVTGMLARFSTAVAGAGGELKGLGTVLKSSPAMWMALGGTAVAYGLYKLYDVASGAKAAREAMESLNNSMERWKGVQADTFYSNSKGLEAFGMSQQDFRSDMEQGYKWLANIKNEWADELIESDETVAQYVDSFKNLTASTRDSLKDLASTASQYGYTEVSEGMQADIELLDNIDRQVEELLKKRQESFLTDEDIAELNSLLLKREEIEIKYRLSEADTDGFSKLEAGIDAAIARAEATGQEVGVDVYKDALVAGAEGMQAVNKALDEQYNDRYALVQLINDETEKETALAQLNAWYNDERLAAGREYALVMGRAIAPVINSDDIQNTYAQMSDLVVLLSQYSRGEKNVVDLNDFISGLDESNITEFYGLVTQIQSLRDQGLGYDEISSLTGVDVSFLETAYTQLEQINTLLQGMNTDKNLEPLRSMFSEALTEEVLKIATDLDMTGAKEAWAAFAADPGADVFTTAIVEGYQEKEGGADKSGISNPAGFYALVQGYQKDPEGFSSAFDAPSELTALVVGYAKDPEKFSSYFTAPGGLSALVTQYQKDPEGFSAAFDGPAELLAYVIAYSKDPTAFNAAFDDPTGLTAYVTGYGKAPTFKSLFEEPSGLKALVKMYAKDPEFSAVFDNPTGLTALVMMYAKDPKGFSDAFASPEGLNAYVKQYAKDPEFSAYFDGPSGLNALVKAYEADPENFSAFFKSPSGLVALVSAYQQDPAGFSAFFANPSGLLAMVSAYAEDPETFDAAFADPSGLQAMVEGYIADPENFVSTFDGPSGLLALVKAYAEISGGASTAGLAPTVTASVTLSDIDAAALKTWRATNGPKVKLTTTVGLRASVTLGDDWQTKLKEKYDAGLLAVYGVDGMPLNVSPKVLKQLTADSLIVGVDADGTYHVIVKPEWATVTDEEIEDFNEGFTPDTDTYKKLTTKWDQYRAHLAMGGSMHWFGDDDDGFIGALNDAADWVGGAINDVRDFFTEGLTPYEITEFAEATAMLTNAVNDGRNSYQVFGDDAIQFLNDMADATEAANASGKNMDLVNRTLAELASIGINIKATDLPAYLRSMAKGAQYGTANLGSMTSRLNQMNKEVAEAKEESADITGLIKAQNEHILYADYMRQANELRSLTRELTAEEKAYLEAYDTYAKARNEASLYDYRINNSKFSTEASETAAETNIQKALRNAEKYRTLNEQLKQGAIDYETYVSKAGALTNSINMKAWDDYYRDMAKYVEALEDYGLEVPEVYAQFIEAYKEFTREYNSSTGYVENGYSDMWYESTSMDEALEFLSDFTRLSEELGSSEKALKEINAYEEANAAYIYIEQYLALWKKKRDELEAILGEGGTLNEEQAAFMSKYNTLMDFFGEDFLKDVDLTEDGSEIAGSLGEGIENRLKSYDFTGTGSAVADSLDEAVRTPLGANSPATRFIPIGVDIAEGLAAGITSGTSLVTNAIVALANAAVAAAKEALQIHSPSRVFRDEIGAMAMAGFGEGVIAQTEAEGRVIRNAARYLTDEASGGVMAGRNAYNTYNYTTDAPISFEGATFAIREEQDIHSLAQEIASLIKRQQRGAGMRR